jgi:hypothetical protein
VDGDGTAAFNLATGIQQPVALQAREPLDGQAAARPQVVARLIPQRRQTARGMKPRQQRRIIPRPRQALGAREADQTQVQRSPARQRQRRAEHAVAFP